MLAAARVRNLPMVCANPDIVVIRANKPVVCAGAIAARYEAPWAVPSLIAASPIRAVYDRGAGQAVAPRCSRRVIAVVGDALETDIKGARAAGLPSVWCTGGIHAAALGCELRRTGRS